MNVNTAQLTGHTDSNYIFFFLGLKRQRVGKKQRNGVIMMINMAGVIYIYPYYFWPAIDGGGGGAVQTQASKGHFQEQQHVSTACRTVYDGTTRSLSSLPSSLSSFSLTLVPFPGTVHIKTHTHTAVGSVITKIQ